MLPRTAAATTTRPAIGKDAKSSATNQADLFEARVSVPEGFVYRDNLLTAMEEAALLGELEALPFKPFEFQGYLGKRRIATFGWRYDFDRKALRDSDPLPDFLLPVRAKAAIFAGLPPDELQQVLINEYEPGAGVGWHRDRSIFQDIIGISLASACRFRLRRAVGDGWERVSHVLQPRSAYIMRGASRSLWEHSVPGVSALRYSITFRNVANGPARMA